MVSVARCGNLGRGGMNGARPQQRLRLWWKRKRRQNLPRNGGGDIRFHLQDIGKFACERVGPKMRLIADLDQLHIDANLIAGALDAAFQHIFHVQDAANFRDGLAGNNL